MATLDSPDIYALARGPQEGTIYPLGGKNVYNLLANQVITCVY